MELEFELELKGIVILVHGWMVNAVATEFINGLMEINMKANF